jgi:hypothetical protein
MPGLLWFAIFVSVVATHVLCQVCAGNDIWYDQAGGVAGLVRFQERWVDKLRLNVTVYDAVPTRCFITNGFVVHMLVAGAVRRRPGISTSGTFSAFVCFLCFFEFSLASVFFLVS